MKARLSETEVRDRLEPLFRRPGVRLAVLFGSLARGQARASSDVDVGILADVGPGSFEEIRVEALRALGTDAVDVVDLRRATPLLAMAVARDGKVLYEKNTSEFAAFASLALRRYNDTARLRRLREKGLKTFLAEKKV